MKIKALFSFNSFIFFFEFDLDTSWWVLPEQ